MSERKTLRVEDSTLELLNRTPDADYLERCTALLAREREQEAANTEAVIVFRLGGEWLALSCKVFREFTAATAIHRIPHRSDEVLLGITNIRGELQLAVSLHVLLGVEGVASGSEEGVFRRMAVLAKGGDVWVTPVDEVAGLYRVEREQIDSAPVTVGKAAATHTRGIFVLDGKPVALLDDELLFSDLGRRLE